MESLIITPKNKKDLKILTDLAHRLQAEVRTEESPYDPEFVKKIKRGEEAAKKGKGIKVNVDELWT